MPIGVIESLDHEARGIARLDGKANFGGWGTGPASGCAFMTKIWLI